MKNNLTGNGALTFAMTGRNALSTELMKPTGEQAIVRNIPDGGNDMIEINQSYFELRIKIYEGEHDLRSRVNNLSSRKFNSVFEGNSELCLRKFL